MAASLPPLLMLLDDTPTKAKNYKIEDLQFKSDSLQSL